MTDPNLPPETTPPIFQPPAPPANQPPAAAQMPAAPAYGQQQYGQQPYGQQPYGEYPSQKYNVLAIVSLVSAFFISLAAIITGHIALSQIKKTGEKGRGLAIAGLVLGYAGLVFGLIFVIAWFAFFANAVNTGNLPSY